MVNLDDMQLLAEYAARSSEEAFSTLVARHVNLVYSAAWRQTGWGIHAWALVGSHYHPRE